MLKTKCSIARVILIIALPLSVVPVSAQRIYHYKDFSAADRLSNGNVTDFFQDSYGFLWIATGDGLNRYDGHEIQIYKNRPGDDSSLPDNATYEIVEDKEGNIWVGCYNAIGRYNRKSNSFTRYSLENLPFKRPPRFYSSLLDSRGDIWFTASQLGVIRLNRAENKFERILLSDANEDKIWGEVHEIIELTNGVIIAADFSHGLKKYNPANNRFEPYYLKPGYSPKTIKAIYESKNGNVWYGGENLLIKYSTAQYHFVEYDLLKNSPIQTNYKQITGIEGDYEGFIWIGVMAHGVFRVNSTLTNIRQYYHDQSDNSIKEDGITDLFRDKFGIVWTSYNYGGIGQFDPNVISFSSAPLSISNRGLDNSTAVTVIRGSHSDNKNLFVGTSTEGILIYNIETNKFKQLNSVPGRIEKENIRSIVLDGNGRVWYVAQNKNLMVTDPVSGLNKEIPLPHIGKTATIPLGDIRSLNIDHNGDIWIMSSFGVDRYSPQSGEFFTVPRIMNKVPDPALTTSVKSVIDSRPPLSSILKVGEAVNKEEKFTLDKTTKILISCMGEGRKVQGMYDYGSLLDADNKIIWSMNNIDKTFYSSGGFKNRIGYYTTELQPGEYKLNFISDVGHSYGNWNAMAPADSNQWGIQLFEIDENEYQNISELNQKEKNRGGFLPFEMGRVVEISKKYSNTIWIGTFTNSFFRYNFSTGDFKQYNFDKKNISAASHYINCIYEDLDGIVWVGTYSSLVRLEPESGKMNSYTTEDGLPGGIIQSLIEDNFATLWIKTSGGLSKLYKNAPLEKYAFVNYDTRDGFESSSDNFSFWKDDEGRIYFGGKGKIITFEPGSTNSIKPDVVVYDFKVDDISIFADSVDFAFDGNIFNTEQIDLSYSQNDIAFEFASIHFSRPDKNRLSYTLDGFSKKWYLTDRNFATFTNLDPGSYVFRVKGANGDGVWNDKGRSIKINISPPWWMTWWAYASYIIFFVLFLYTIRKFELRRQLKNARIKESELKAKAAEMQAKAAEAQNRAIQAENDRKSKELEEARALQLSLLPKDVPVYPGIQISTYMKTATEVGGDYYDFSSKTDGSLNVAIGDATGHGMKAGTLVTAMKALFSSGSSEVVLESFFMSVNSGIKKMNMERVMMGFAMLNIHEKEIRLINAGMPPVLLYKKTSDEVEEIKVHGMPLGAMEQVKYEATSMSLATGDTLLLMSDGMPELQNDKGEMFGYERISAHFKQIAQKSPEEIIENLKTAGSDWINDNDPDDDVTFVVIKMN